MMRPVVGYWVVAVVILLGVVAVLASDADLSLSKATSDVAVYRSHPEQFELVVRPENVGGDIFVQRSPIFRLSLARIKRAIVKKQPVYSRIEDAAREALRQGPGRPSERHGGKFIYHVTLELDDEGGRAFRGFAGSHQGELVDVQLGGRRLGIPRLIGPFTGSSITIATLYDDEAKMKEIMRPLGARVTLE